MTKRSALPWYLQNDAERRATVRAAMRLGAQHAHPAWALIHARAKALGLPRAFASDLFVHDRRALEQAPRDARFIWAIGESGTYLHWIARKGYLCCKYSDAHSIAEYLTQERPHIFYWDGATLSAIDRDAAAEFFQVEPTR